LPETHLAVIPGGGGTQRLPRLVGKARAMELIFTGKPVNAVEALDMGLVNRTCKAQDLMRRAENMASMVCEAGPVALEQAKYAINAGLETDLHTGLAIESSAYFVTIPTEDRKEALSAFREKRKPNFKGK
jgi:enoyl-CoA hydratase/carnithine racemase